VRSAALALALVALAAAGTAGAAPPAQLQVRAYADTGLKLTDVLWTGTRFLYVENTTNTVWAAGPSGVAPQQFASMPNEVEETRCRLSPGTHGWPAGLIFCHAPDNTIYRLSSDGASVTVFAKLPETATSDGALAFDTVGRFGYGLVAATGRSGNATPAGGTVYVLDPAGNVKTVATYPGPGGADEVAIAPASFGSEAGAAVLTVDAGGTTGYVTAVDAQGHVRTIARLPDGPNPIVAVAPTTRTKGLVPAGLYVTDTASHKVFFVSAAQLAPDAGDLVVGTEIKGQLWVVRPRGAGFQTRQLPTDLPAVAYNLEGATYLR